MLTILNPETFDWENMSLSDACEGNAVDTYFTLRLFEKLEAESKLEGTDKIDEKLLGPLIPEIAFMEYNGLEVGEEELTKVSVTLRDMNMDKEDSMYRFHQVKNTESLFSTDDLVNILFLNEEGFALYPPKFTETVKEKTGEYPPSTDAECLDELMALIEAELLIRGKNG